MGGAVASTSLATGQHFGLALASCNLYSGPGIGIELTLALALTLAGALALALAFGIRHWCKGIPMAFVAVTHRQSHRLASA